LLAVVLGTNFRPPIRPSIRLSIRPLIGPLRPSSRVIGCLLGSHVTIWPPKPTHRLQYKYNLFAFVPKPSTRFSHWSWALGFKGVIVLSFSFVHNGMFKTSGVRTEFTDAISSRCAGV
jgi:hypothetical protein